MNSVAMNDRRLCQLSATSGFVVLIAGQSSMGSAAMNVPVAALAVSAVLAVFLGPVALRVRQTERSPALTRVFWLVFALLAVLLASAMWANGGSSTFDEILWIIALVGMLALVSATAQLDPRATVDTFMLLSVIAGSIFAVAGLLDSTGYSRISAFGGGPNVFARITGIGIVGVLYWALRGYRGWPAFIALVPLLAVATLLSGSRGAILGALAGLLVVASAFGRRTLLRLMVLLLIMAPVVLVVYSLYGRQLQTIFNQRIVKLTFEEGYTAGRNTLWAAAGDLFGDDPVLGSGLGTYINENGFYAHNLILQVAVDAGIVGISALLLCWAVILKKLVGGHIRNPLVLGPSAAAVVILVASMFSGDYYDSRFFWAFMIMACAMVTRLNRRDMDATTAISCGAAASGRVT